MKKIYIGSIILFIALVALYHDRTHARIYSMFYKTSNPNKDLNYTIGNPKATKTIKYAALGDSLTAGVGALEIQNSLPYLLADKFLDKNTNVQLFNLGQPGARTVDVLQQQLLPLDSYHPDVITLFIGTNDIHWKDDVETFKQNYASLLDGLKKFNKAKIIVINIPYIGADKLILPPHNWYLNHDIKKYNAIISGLVKTYDYKYIDLYSLQNKSQINQEDFYSPDLFHPSANGYKLWSEIIYANSR